MKRNAKEIAQKKLRREYVQMTSYEWNKTDTIRSYRLRILPTNKFSRLLKKMHPHAFSVTFSYNDWNLLGYNENQKKVKKYIANLVATAFFESGPNFIFARKSTDWRFAYLKEAYNRYEYNEDKTESVRKRFSDFKTIQVKKLIEEFKLDELEYELEPIYAEVCKTPKSYSNKTYKYWWNKNINKFKDTWYKSDWNSFPCHANSRKTRNAYRILLNDIVKTQEVHSLDLEVLPK